MGSVTLRVILWTPSGPCAPWGASGPATTSPGPPSPSSSSPEPPSPSSSSSEIPQNEEGTLKKARPRFYKERDSTKNEILQRPRFYKERDSTKNEILQRTRFYKERDSTKNEILQNEEGTLKKARPRFFTIRALRPMGGIWASNNKSRASVTLIIKFTGADSPPSKSSNSQHRIHRAWTLCLTRCTRCTSEATKKRE